MTHVSFTIKAESISTFGTNGLTRQTREGIHKFIASRVNLKQLFLSSSSNSKLWLNSAFQKELDDGVREIILVKISLSIKI